MMTNVDAILATDSNEAASGLLALVNINHTPGIITITDANTTIGYCRYSDAGEIEYLFVGATQRRKGYAMQLLEAVQAHLQTTLRFQLPLSPLGRKLVEGFGRRNPLGL